MDKPTEFVVNANASLCTRFHFHDCFSLTSFLGATSICLALRPFKESRSQRHLFAFSAVRPELS